YIGDCMGMDRRGRSVVFFAELDIEAAVRVLDAYDNPEQHSKVDDAVDRAMARIIAKYGERWNDYEYAEEQMGKWMEERSAQCKANQEAGFMDQCPQCPNQYPCLCDFGPHSPENDFAICDSCREARDDEWRKSSDIPF